MFPVLFVLLIAVIMLTMYMYQKVVLYDAASVSAERTAFRWDNSHRDPVSGIEPVGQYDGLYWRMADNGALQSLFGFGKGSGDGNGGGYKVAIGGEGDAPQSASTSLPVIKMGVIAATVPRPFEGEMSYSYGMLEKKITVKLLQPISIDPLTPFLGDSTPRNAGSASIVDPVELIRNVDLVRYYTAKFGKDKDGEAKREQASQVLQKRASLGG